MSRPYRIRRTLMGWMVTTGGGGYAFADSHAAAIERAAEFEVAHLGGWEWYRYQSPAGRVFLLNAHTGQTRTFHNHQQAALFLHALNTKRKTPA